MLVRKQFVFPRPDVEGIDAVEKKYLEILHRVREHESVEDEEIDYLDYANNVLLAA